MPKTLFFRLLKVIVDKLKWKKFKANQVNLQYGTHYLCQKQQCLQLLSSPSQR